VERYNPESSIDKAASSLIDGSPLSTAGETMQVPAAALHLCAYVFPDSVMTTLIALRWVHFVAGITWVGLLYFFNLVSIPFFRQLDPQLRAKVMPALMSRALFWFRWAAVVTVLAGIWYWMRIVVVDAQNADVSPGKAIWSFFGLWTLAFIIYMGVIMSPSEALHKGPVLAIITAAVTSGAAYGYVQMNSHGWESNRLLCIGIGGGLGWFMMFNVWGLLWRMQKRLIQWTAQNSDNGTPMPEKAASFTRLSMLVSRTNLWLSFPMLFFMAAASHYPIFSS
jgi:uncharacterized membrane protein